MPKTTRKKHKNEQMLKLDKNSVISAVFTARCYAYAVLAMGLCLSVRVRVRVCHKSEFY